jgi:hypothetical protein
MILSILSLVGAPPRCDLWVPSRLILRFKCKTSPLVDDIILTVYAYATRGQHTGLQVAV